LLRVQDGNNGGRRGPGRGADLREGQAALEAVGELRGYDSCSGASRCGTSARRSPRASSWRPASPAARLAMFVTTPCLGRRPDGGEAARPRLCTHRRLAQGAQLLGVPLRGELSEGRPLRPWPRADDPMFQRFADKAGEELGHRRSELQAAREFTRRCWRPRSGAAGRASAGAPVHPSCSPSVHQPHGLRGLHDSRTRRTHAPTGGWCPAISAVGAAARRLGGRRRRRPTWASPAGVRPAGARRGPPSHRARDPQRAVMGPRTLAVIPAIWPPSTPRRCPGRSPARSCG
jgi:hypothetical protein